MAGLEDVERALRALLRAADRVSLREPTIQDVLAGELNGRARVRVGSFLEADVLAGDLCIEVKVNRRPYEGFLQAALIKRRLGLRLACVVHVVDELREEQLELIRECVALTGVPCVVLELSSGRILREGEQVRGKVTPSGGSEARMGTVGAASSPAEAPERAQHPSG
mgnify:CR=1 FL=1